MLILEAIDKWGIKIDGSTVQVYTPPCYIDIRSFIRCVFPKRNRQIGNNISRWILDKNKKNNQFHMKKVLLQETHGIARNSLM